MEREDAEQRVQPDKSFVTPVARRLLQPARQALRARICRLTQCYVLRGNDVPKRTEESQQFCRRHTFVMRGKS